MKNEYKYVVFINENKDIIVIPRTLERQFTDSYVYTSQLIELERGTFKKSDVKEGQTNYLGCVFDKKKEWENKLADNKQNKDTNNSNLKGCIKMKNVKNIVKGLLVVMVVTVGCFVNGFGVGAESLNSQNKLIKDHYTLQDGSIKTVYNYNSFVINSDVTITDKSFIDNTVTFDKDGQLYSFYVDDVKSYYINEKINVTMNQNNEVIDCIIDSEPVIYKNINISNVDNDLVYLVVNDNKYAFINEEGSEGWKVNDKCNVVIQDGKLLEVRPVPLSKR